MGLDANPDAMRKASVRAAAKHGVPNALFVWASVEQLPPELTGVTELHAIMPWGSLLRALLAPEPGVLARLAGACRPGARFQVAVNLHPWRQPAPATGTAAGPELAGIPEPDPELARDRLASAYQAAGWRLEQAAYLTDPEIDALHSSWTRRLRSSRPGRFDVLGLTGTIAG